MGRSFLSLLLCLGAMVGVPALSRAADAEVRDFAIWVDGKRGGEYHMTIQAQDDGTISMGGQADVRLSFLAGLKVYTYTYRGTEVWKDGKLVSFTSNSNDDGKQLWVNAAAEANGLRVKSSGGERVTRADAWVTTYWRLPTANQRNGAVPLIDGDTGRDINANLQYVGASQVNVAGQGQNCSHYRLTGGVQVDLWFDAAERLVREEFVEDGHKTILELTRIRR
jgi:hypothetical protein